MKKIMFLVITIFVSFFMVSKVNALSGYTTNTYVGYREGPGTNYKRLGQVNEKNTVLLNFYVYSSSTLELTL